MLTGTEELARALDYPWERWIVFLHPSQADWVGRSFKGTTRVQGSAGTGKTVVALHRAVHLARRNPEARVLLTTFSEPLAALLQDKLHRLIQGEPSLIERLDVLAMQKFGERIHPAQLGMPQLITSEHLRALIQRHAPAEISRVYGEAFVVDECQDITAGQLRLLAALAGTSTDALFFAGDLGQRIFQQPFSWTQVGVDIRGRSRTLRISRSAKPAELAHQPAVELCWLLPRARSQFRLRGSLQTLAPEQVQRERERHWQMLSPGGRALWGWPPPGEPFDPEAAFPEQLPDGSPLPDHFLLLHIALAQVELLELTGHPHRRRRWRGESGWAEERLNP